MSQARRYADEDNDGRPDVAEVVGAQADAKNRAIRTLAQQLALDVTIAVVLFLFPIFGSTSTDWSTLDWRLIGLSIVKTVLATVLAFLMRRFKISPRTTTV